MNLPEQVCTLEQARKFKSLGVSQETFLYHYRGLREDDHGLQDRGYFIGNTCKNAAYSAYTVAELGAMWPERLEYDGKECFLSSEKYVKQATLAAAAHAWISGIHTVYKSPHEHSIAKKYFPGPSEAYVRAEVLIWLLEKKLVALEGVNERLQQ